MAEESFLEEQLPDILLDPPLSIENQSGRLAGDNLTPFWPREDNPSLIESICKDIVLKLSKPVKPVKIDQIQALFSKDGEKPPFKIRNTTSGGLVVEFYNVPDPTSDKLPDLKYIFDQFGRMIQEEHTDGIVNEISSYGYDEKGYIIERIVHKRQVTYKDTFQYKKDQEGRMKPSIMYRTILHEKEDNSHREEVSMKVDLTGYEKWLSSNSAQ